MLTKYKNTFTLKDIVDDGDEYEFRFEINPEFTIKSNPYYVYDFIDINQQKGKTLVLLGQTNTIYPMIWDLNKSNTILMLGNHQSEYEKMIKDMMVSLMMFSQSQQEMQITLISDSKRYDDIREDHAYIRRLTSNTIPNHFIEDLELDIERRQSLLNQEDCNNIEEFNNKMHHRNEKVLPKHVIIIDDVEHIINDNKLNDVMNNQRRLKLGIYFIIAVSNHSRISPCILAQTPSRIVMQVDDEMQSEMMINQHGAENLRLNGEFYAMSSNIDIDDKLGRILDTDSEYTKSYHHGNSKTTINKLNDAITKTND